MTTTMTSRERNMRKVFGRLTGIFCKIDQRISQFQIWPQFFPKGEAQTSRCMAVALLGQPPANWALACTLAGTSSRSTVAKPNLAK
jgi:hypothetical protein